MKWVTYVFMSHGHARTVLPAQREKYTEVHPLSFDLYHSMGRKTALLLLYCECTLVLMYLSAVHQAFTNQSITLSVAAFIMAAKTVFTHLAGITSMPYVMSVCLGYVGIVVTY